MAKLDLYTGRIPHSVDLLIAGKKVTLVIPTDFTVEELERLLELEEAYAGKMKLLDQFKLHVAQLTMLVCRANPGISAEWVAQNIEHNDVEKITDFVLKNAFKIRSGGEDEETGKKKARKNS